jgi:hypothetical protein
VRRIPYGRNLGCLDRLTIHFSTQITGFFQDITAGLVSISLYVRFQTLEVQNGSDIHMGPLQNGVHTAGTLYYLTNVCIYRLCDTKFRYLLFEKLVSFFVPAPVE